MKITITRTGYDPALGPKHPDNQDPTLVAHVLVMDNRGMAHDAPHRWRCSCGKEGEWKSVIRSARIGGAKHVAAMERGR